MRLVTIISIVTCINVSTFVSPFYTFSWPGNNCSHAKSRYQVGKSTLIVLLTKQKCRIGLEINAFTSISFFIGRSFSIFWLKINAFFPSEWDIKVHFPAPNFTIKIVDQRLSIIGKYKNKS